MKWLDFCLQNWFIIDIILSQFRYREISGTVAKKGGGRNEETLLDFINLMSVFRWSWL